MKDYPEINMFTDDRPEKIASLMGHVPEGIMVIVSPFDPNKTEEENVVAVRNLYLNVPGQQSAPMNLVYGEANGEGYGIIIFRPYPLEPTLGYCQTIVQDRNQPGLITWSHDDGAFFIAADGSKNLLPEWNKTLARLEEWCQHLKPGFMVKGIWNREMTFVHMRQAQLQGKFPKHNH